MVHKALNGNNFSLESARRRNNTSFENYMKRAFLRAQKHFDFIKKLMRKLWLKLSILPLTLRKNPETKI